MINFSLTNKIKCILGNNLILMTQLAKLLTKPNY